MLKKNNKSTAYQMTDRRNSVKISIEQQLGFTLMEVMLTVAIVGVLSAVAIPSYTNYVERGKIADALSSLSLVATQMERSFLDNQTYSDGSGCAVSAPSVKDFTLSCTSTTTTFTWTAKSSDSKFEFTIDQDINKTTVKFDGKSISGSDCWFITNNGTCV